MHTLIQYIHSGTRASSWMVRTTQECKSVKRKDPTIQNTIPQTAEMQFDLTRLVHYTIDRMIKRSGLKHIKPITQPLATHSFSPSPSSSLYNIFSSNILPVSSLLPSHQTDILRPHNSSSVCASGSTRLVHTRRARRVRKQAFCRTMLEEVGWLL